MKHYPAPWSTLLIVMSALVTVLCVGISAGMGWAAFAKHQPGLIGGLALLPLAILLATALFTIRGYTITPSSILVHRLFWDTDLPRAGLESASVDPDAMRGSLRTFGNGGAFSFSGLYYNKRMGSYRAFVTDPHQTVVLRYASRRVVLSPEAPESFVNDLGVRRPADAVESRSGG
jgi:hypothetical protein